MENSTSVKTDWMKCCLCQEEEKEKLISPPTSITLEEDGYTNIAKNIPLFHNINELPILLNPSRLDEGGGIEATLRRNSAKYHQSCRFKFNNTKLKRAEKRKLEVELKNESHKQMRRNIPSSEKKDRVECFLCDAIISGSEHREAMTLQLNKRLNECAETLNVVHLLAKLSGPDVVAKELKYHPKCLAGLYNMERAHLRALKHSNSDDSTDDAYPIAFSELVTYIKESRDTGESSRPIVHRLADLVDLYKQRLFQLGVETPSVNSTRLKDKLISHLPIIEAIKNGRDILIAFKKDIGQVLSDASKYSDAVHLAKAADILRKQMLNHKQRFDFEFYDKCDERSVPHLLLQFVCMIEHGADIKSQLEHCSASKSDLVVAQLLQYNCFATYKEESTSHRHSKDRETPFPIYAGISVFARTRNRKLIDMLHENGVSISYDRVLQISTQLGEAVVSKYVEDGVVCPPAMKKGTFTTAAIDNIDHNPTSTSASTSFHGTSISLFQHPSADNMGEVTEKLNVQPTNTKKISELPESFTNVKPAHFVNRNPQPPQADDFTLPDPASFRRSIQLEFEWLQKVMLTEEIDGDVAITWAAHHASQLRCEHFEVSLTSLMPLLRDQAHSVATVKHCMDKVTETVQFLNPGQVPVIAADQPLFALAKQIQWSWPTQYGEDKYVIMFGGLHIEMAAFKMLGNILKGSGWSSVLTEGEIASSGTAESYTLASSVTRTRQAHQITACTLYQLLKATYNEREQNDEADFDGWCEEQCKKYPQFRYWQTVLEVELIIFTFIRSIREANFSLYQESLSNLIPYFFANDNVHYSRWLPIHLKDMLLLEKQHPSVAGEFNKGNFVVHKSDRTFSAMAIDQAHEQNNAVVKGEGGAIGLTGLTQQQCNAG